MGKKSISQTRGLSMVAKLVKSKSMPDEFRSEVEDIDHALRAGAEAKAFLKQLETLYKWHSMSLRMPWNLSLDA